MEKENSKRDLSLIRSIMLNVEAGIRQTDYPGYEREQVLYNKWLLIDSEMAIGGTLTSNDRLVAVSLLRLTWKGCEFLDLAREDARWESAMKKVVSTVGSASLQILTGVLQQNIISKMGMG